ncbi:MAG TPA: 5'/3'-nucleotidase SurE [Pseudonocardia sp.]|nr:5'/3'-nucleotidase SurE [Pseudonocardia sp.]
MSNSSRRLHALITNDDGIDSPGLSTLAAAARDAGLDVTVAAPHVDASGVSASVQAVREGDRVAVHARELPDLPGVAAFAVEAHPAFIVHAAGRGWLDPEPDLVLSGINLGANVGHAILHSGTVGAALTAALHGWRGLAVSLDTGWHPPPSPHFASAGALLPEVLDLLLAAPAGSVFSLNVPDRPVDGLGELREARLARFGTVQVRVAQRDGPAGSGLHARPEELSTPPEPGTDTALLAAGHPTLTALRPVGEEPGVLDGREHRGHGTDVAAGRAGTPA